MAWFEKDLDKGTLNPIEPGIRRTLGSIFHNPGQPQVKISFLDEDQAQILVPDISIKIFYGVVYNDKAVENSAYKKD